MATVAIDERPETVEAQALEGLARLRLSGPRRGEARVVVDLQAVTGLDAVGVAALLEARRVLETQAGGTLVLRANGVMCRALKDTGTIAAFALWNGPGM